MREIGHSYNVSHNTISKLGGRAHSCSSVRTRRNMHRFYWTASKQ
jgi:hypothetical protein